MSGEEIQNPARYAAFRALFLRAQEPISMTEARRLLDAYAHELAEKIRNSKELRDYTDDHMGDCNMAADLIDPEVLNSGQG